MIKWETIIKLMLFITTAYVVFYFSNRRITHEQENILIIGTNTDYPPFSFMKDDAIVGFDIDVAYEIGKRLNKKIKLEDMAFNALIPKLQFGSIHMIAAGMSPTKERAQQVLFTKPYFSGGSFLIISLAKNPPINSIDDLNGKEVIVNEGYTADTYMSSLQGPHIIRLNTPAEAIMALQRERAFAFVASKSSIQPFFDQYGSEQFNVYSIPNTNEGVALAISKKYPELVPQVQEALDAMEKDGTLETLIKKWNL